MTPDTFANYSYIVVCLTCSRCARKGQYRLVRLAAKYGPDIRMDALLEHLAGDCADWPPPHPSKPGCGAFFGGLEQRPPPETLPAPLAVRLRVVR